MRRSTHGQYDPHIGLWLYITEILWWHRLVIFWVLGGVQGARGMS